MTKKIKKFKSIPFKVVKQIVIDDFKKTQDKYNDHHAKIFLGWLKGVDNIQQLVNVISSIHRDHNRTTGCEDYEFLLDLLIKE